MRRFFTFFGLGFALPAMATAVAFWLLLARANELSLLEFEQMVTREDVLWGPAFYQGGAYKLRRYAKMSPDILILGSSRVTQFRDFMAAPATLYNASLAATSLSEARAFLSAAFRRHRPVHIILGIDPWWFAPAWADMPEAGLNGDFSKDDIDWRAVTANALAKSSDLHFLKSLADRPIEIDPVGHRRTVGYMAGYFASGFRPDGSRQYGEQLIVRQPYFDQMGYGYTNGFRYYRDKIRKSTDRFAYVGPLSGKAENTLRAIIALCRAEGVPLTLLLPPFPHAIYEEIQSVPAQRDYFARVEAATAQIAAEGGVGFFNVHDLAQLGVDDRQSIDDIHVDEIATAATFLKVVEASPLFDTLVSASSRAALRTRLAHPEGWATPNILAP